jgi:iron-sulfur cluster repair protein YtfE (RIC family)
LGRLASVFDSLRSEMEMHMHKEELMLFPFIERYGRAQATNRQTAAAGSFWLDRELDRSDGA